MIRNVDEIHEFPLVARADSRSQALISLSGAYHHLVAPSDWCAQGDLLKHAEADVSLHLLLPVDRYRYRGVAGFWGGCWVYVESEGWARHHRQSLMFADVECAGRIRLE